jgi:hypothetical protein
MKRSLQREIEFNIEVPSGKKQSPEATSMPFVITPESLENVKAVRTSSRYGRHPDSLFVLA